MESRIGSIEPGKEADLVMVERDSVNMFPCYNPYSALVYSAERSNVSRVWVAGQELVKDGAPYPAESRRNPPPSLGKYGGFYRKISGIFRNYLIRVDNPARKC